ncbi:MAG TPA: tRNA-dihydrouridine synthase family protein [Anaerolineae bacterium]|nr:tRNA-dihydrouridine synthase family protein [Anaerolineae bacterium]
MIRETKNIQVGAGVAIEEKEAPAFWVGRVPVYGRAILSPMAGYSDLPYRTLCRQFGSAMSYSEFVPVEGLLGKKQNRYWSFLDYEEGERPMVFQIFGNDARKILAAAQRIEEWGPDIIDINMGCSTRRVSGRGAGVGMMPQPELVAETFRLLTHHLEVPVTGKIRLGWDDLRNYIEIGRILEDNGASLVAMHGRTKEQKYNGEANWEAIGELKAALSIPVIGNGDVVEVADIERMMVATGCDGVMIGRGGMGNPWIFSYRDKETVTDAELVRVMRDHGQRMADYYGDEHGARLFRKHLKQYVGERESFVEQVDKLVRLKTMGAVLACLDAIIDETS